MTTTPIQFVQSSNGTSTQAPDRPQPDEDATARFRQTLAGSTLRFGGDLGTSAEPRPSVEPRSGFDANRVLDPQTGPEPKSEGRQSTLPSDFDRRDQNTPALAGAMTIGSLHYSLPLAQLAAEPATTVATADINRLIEQATSVMVERASRADASRFIVSLDHAIMGGASAEFVRDGAFLHVRLLARNDAAYRSMWAHQAELQERLAASTGLTTRVEIVEGYGDGRSA